MSKTKERAEKICLNCNTELYDRYCHKCGQENIEPKQSFWHFVSHFFYDITHFDGKFFSTLKYLIWKPGFLSSEYIKGRRRSYLDPIRMYVFSASLFFLIFFSMKREVKGADSVLAGYFFVLSEPKKYKGEALIPELFKQSRELVPEYSPLYSYAIYSDDELIDHYNEYGFPTHLSESDAPKSEFVTRSKGAFQELWHRMGSQVVVIARRDNSFIEAITLFAYLFSTFLFLLAVYRLISVIIRSRLRWTIIRQHLQLSIRSQIHSTILMVSILSFVVIGIATILFFTKRYERNNQDRISRTIEIMVSDLQKKIKEHEEFNDGIFIFEPGVNAEVERLMQDISEIHGTDINLYDPQGTLRVTSNPFIYNNIKGVLSLQMNPMSPTTFDEGVTLTISPNN